MAKKVLYQALAFVPVVAAPVAADVLFTQTQTIVPVSQSLLYQSVAEPVQFSFQPAVSADQWLAAWSQPQPKSWRPEPITVFVHPNVSTHRWFTPLSEPVRPRIATPSQSVAFTGAAPFTETVSVDRWLQPLDRPALRRPSTPDQTSAFVPVVAGNSGNGDVLFAQTSYSIRYERTLLYQSWVDPVNTTAAPAAPSVSSWLAQFSVPPDGAGMSIDLSATFFAVEPSFGWFARLSEPQWRRPNTHELASRAISPPFGETITVDKWYRAFAEPVRQKPLNIGFVAYPAFLQGETVTADKWFRPFAEPTRRTPLNLGFIVYTGAAPFGETITLDKWYRPLGEPTRRKLFNLSVADYPGSSPFGETITVDKWYRPLAEPTRRKRQAAEGSYAFTVTVTAPTPGNDDVRFSASSTTINYTRDLLYQSVAEPLRFQQEIITVDKWFTPLVDPVRVKRQPLRIPDPYTPPSGRQISPPYGWYAPLVDPVWHRRFATATQAAFYTPPSGQQITPPYGWFASLGQPVRVQPRGYANAPTGFYFQGIANPVPSMASWNEWWVNPVQRLAGLLTALQSDSTMPIIPIPNPPAPGGQYTVSGLYVIDQFTDNTVVYDYDGRVSHRTN